MADFDGATAGIAAFHADQDMQVQTLQRFGQMEHMAAITEQARAQTEHERLQTQREQQMLTALAQRNPDAQAGPGGKTPAQQLQELGGVMSQAGFFKEAGDLFNKASEIGHREELERQAALGAKQKLAQQKLKAITDAHELVSGASDQASLDQLLSIWQQEHPGEDVPKEFKTYNEPLFEALRKVTKSGQAQAKLEEAEITHAEMDAYRKAQVEREKRADKDRADHWKAIEEGNKTREERLTKSTGKKGGGPKPSLPGRPSTMEIQEAHSMILRSYPDIVPDMQLGKDTMVSSAAADMASEAKALVARNKGGMSYPQALAQVFAQMVKTKSFDTMQTPPSFAERVTGKKGATQTHYKPDVPITYVKGQTKLEDGKKYILPNTGDTYVYREKTKSFDPVE